MFWGEFFFYRLDFLNITEDALRKVVLSCSELLSRSAPSSAISMMVFRSWSCVSRGGVVSRGETAVSFSIAPLALEPTSAPASFLLFNFFCFFAVAGHASLRGRISTSFSGVASGAS